MQVKAFENKQYSENSSALFMRGTANGVVGGGRNAWTPVGRRRSPQN